MRTTAPSMRISSRVMSLALTIGLAAGVSFAKPARVSTPTHTTTTHTATATPPQTDERPGVKVYTNADLAKLEPLPQQKAPLVAPLGWDFVFSVLDRERELMERRQDREGARDRGRRESVTITNEDLAGYGYPWYGAYGPFPYPQTGPYVVNAPSNPSNSLSARGVRTAEDLYRESLENSRIRRQSIP